MGLAGMEIASAARPFCACGETQSPSQAMKTLLADKIPEAHLERLRQLGCVVSYSPTVKAEELPAIISDHKILIVRGKQVTAETLKAPGALNLVLRAGAGVNAIDVKTASALGIFVTNCPGKNSIAVAELVFALLLAVRSEER